MKTTTEGLAERLERLYIATRERTRQLFDWVAPEAYTDRPIPLRHPLVFYDGHLDAFLYNLVLKAPLGVPSANPAYDQLFARGIDPETEAAAGAQAIGTWPSRRELRMYKAEIALHLYRALRDPASFERPGLVDGELFFMGLEHELMHQETLTYLIHQLPHDRKRRPEGWPEPDLAAPPAPRMVEVPTGTALLGARPGEFPFSWDNERPALALDVPAFAVDSYPVTNADYMAFVEEGGYTHREFWSDEAWAWRTAQHVTHPHYWRRDPDRWRWRGLFEDHPLPPAWPVHVTHAEASAYARYAGKALPTEAEWHRAAFGDRQDAPYPWGPDAPTPEHGNFDFRHGGPTPVGRFPRGAGPLGVHDAVGNVWEWTATPFGPFSGFEAHPAYPGYSADFFDGKHFVLKGGSWATDALLVRRSFRNWFFWHYPYMYAGFRCVLRH